LKLALLSRGKRQTIGRLIRWPLVVDRGKDLQRAGDVEHLRAFESEHDDAAGTDL
jgi:hypothetical protein